MTGKRFKIESTMMRDCIVDNDTGEQLDTFDYTERLCEVLNALHEENGKLRYDYNEKCNEYMGLEEQIDNLLKENEQLKYTVSAYMVDLNNKNCHLYRMNLYLASQIMFYQYYFDFDL